ncbi:MAG: redox-regulated ATPase YchF [Candidatus Thermoplasmatota archaeon]|jgi:ribosome-binding ATPase YchF (GTP1/OBG family)|nr:redox-regulated ATPase YchF [Candidatus Thermoplasmatota archaeon]MCL5983753.1 redox-regulated ATPase YchF [Candidatus Thermoplasmatota archaeon]
MEIGVVGKPNVGKSTFFNALTLLDVPMAPFPFTTIAPSRGVAAVRTRCPHLDLGVPCTPGNAACVDGTRWVPVNLIDVPGLVPGAHEGRGLGHKFLDDLRPADGFLQVVDLSGATDAEGVIGAPGSHDPAEEVHWLEEELVSWASEILARDFERQARVAELEGKAAEEILASRLTGLSISMGAITTALRATGFDRSHPSTWTADQRRTLARELLRTAKPRLVVANKADRSTPEAAHALAESLAPLAVVPTSADQELTLRRAARAGLVRYRPGDATFDVPDEDRLSPAQRRALDGIRLTLSRWGSTGVQSALETMVFDRLHRMVVYPVEDETHWTDGKGRVLPDAHIVPIGTTARQLAYRVHTVLGENFIRAIDARTHRALGAEHPLEPNAVVRIVARR